MGYLSDLLLRFEMSHDSFNEDDPYRHYAPIENYGIIGAMRTCALINKKNASVDYMCYPDFDSPSLFCRLLDCQKGGFWEISVAEEFYPEEGQWKNACTSELRFLKHKQIYMPNSNILLTRYNGKSSISHVVDLMPVVSDHLEAFKRVPFSIEARRPTAPSLESIPIPWVIRKVEVIRGRVKIRVRCMPHFDYARQNHTVQISPDKGVFKCDALKSAMELSYCMKDPDFRPQKWTIDSSSNQAWPGIVGEFELDEGQDIFFIFRQVPYKQDESESKLPCFTLMDYPIAPNSIEKLILDTTSYWHKWVRTCKYDGNYRSWVYRSALLLKLMTYYPTGAIIAAPTFSIPEEIGGKLNWDYRFTWIRDASFTIYAFLRLDLRDEAQAFMGWIEERCIDCVARNAELSILYDVRGNSPQHMISSYWSTSPPHSDELARLNDKSVANSQRYSSDIYERPTKEEVILEHLEGYGKSWPVRIGNGAVNQLQLDIYGELMDSIYLVDKYCQQISYDFWLFIKDYLVPTVLEKWIQPDYSIWEFRHGRQHYTYSKIMCWVTLDRAIRLANKHSFPAPDRIKWQQVRDEIYIEVMEKGYDKRRGVFTQFYGSQELDASTLIMPLVFFMPANDPRFLKTLSAIMKKPKDGGLTINHLVFRTSQNNTTQPYMVDASYLENEGTFNLCTFWLIEALSRTNDPEYLKIAEFMFEAITSFANHLGLFSEELSISGKATGNFPQAFTHLSLISAAYSLDRCIGMKN